MGYDRLILLPCHAIWRGQESPHAKGLSASEWFLAPFQLEGHDHHCFVEHIAGCFEQLKQHPGALLVISGGQTKADAGPISEALSYYQLAWRMLGGSEPALFERVVLEEFARDSFENVLFSACRFHEVAGSYAGHITVVGFEFKRPRFLKCHLAEALGFPESRVEYIGNAPRPGPEIDHDKYFADLVASEEKHALSPFRKDPYGLRTPLSGKRKQRDPFHRNHGYELSNPALSGLFEAMRNGVDDSPDAVRSKVQVLW